MVLTTKQYIQLGLLMGVGILAYALLFDTPRAFLENMFEKSTPDNAVTSFEKCAEKYPVMESYPEQCRTKEGVLFVRDIGNEMEMMDTITNDTPRPGERVSLPLILEGSAVSEFFSSMGRAEVSVFSSNGVKIGSGFIESIDSDRNETDKLSYTGEILFSSEIQGKKGEIYIQSNRGVSEVLRIPIIF